MSYFEEQENLDDLFRQIPESFSREFSEMGYSRVEAAYFARLFVVYQPQGLQENRQHRHPKILGLIRVNDFSCDTKKGASFTIEDLNTGDKLTIGHIPVKVFDYDVFIHIPPVFRMRWDARQGLSGVERSLVFPVSIFSKNGSYFHSYGVTYMDTPPRLRKLYEGINIKITSP